MKLRKDIGILEVKNLGIVLTQESTPDQISRALKHAPHLSKFIDNPKSKSDGKKETSA